MDERESPSSTPILEYAKSSRRPGSLLLANLVAIIGMCLWVVGCPLVLFGIIGLIDSIGPFPRERFGASALSLLVGIGIWYVAFLLCRSVRGIYTGG
jgi:hypothetical protein